MPIYEYRCGACGHELEALQKLSESPLTDCPACGKSQLAKLVSAAGFQLKGSGWYATDFRNSGAKPAAKANGEGATAKADGGAGKSDSKPESKSESKSEAKSETPSSASSGGCGSNCSCH